MHVFTRFYRHTCVPLCLQGMRRVQLKASTFLISQGGIRNEGILFSLFYPTKSRAIYILKADLTFALCAPLPKGR